MTFGLIKHLQIYCLTKKHINQPPELWNQVLWTDDTKINLYQNDEKTKVWRRETAHDPKETSSCVQHNMCSDMNMYVCQWNWMLCLLMTWLMTEGAGWDLKCVELYSLLTCWPLMPTGPWLFLALIFSKGLHTQMSSVWLQLLTGATLNLESSNMRELSLKGAVSSSSAALRNRLVIPGWGSNLPVSGRTLHN